MVKCDKRLYKFARHHIEDLLAYDVKDRALHSKDQYLKLLIAASLVNGFAEGVSQSLSSSPTGETLLSYIKSQDQTRLREEFDRLIELNIRTLRKNRKLSRPVPIAIDWHDVMYYGDPGTPMVIGTQHKNGSNYAYEYLTASVLVDGKRIIVSVMPMSLKSDASMLAIEVIKMVQMLGIRISYITMDGGFYNIDVLRFLEESGIRYVVHMHMTSKAKRMKLRHGMRFTYKTNSHKRGFHEQLSFDVMVAYDKEKKYTYLFATNMHYSAKALLTLFMKRWGIETSYRMCNQFLVIDHIKKLHGQALLLSAGMCYL